MERATGSDRMDAFLGLHKRNPLLAAVLLVLFLSLAGIPPLVGFWAKFNLFAAVLGGHPQGAGRWRWWRSRWRMSAVSLYYYLQVLKRAYVMPAVDDSPIAVHPVTLFVLLVIAAAVVVLGCFPALLQGGLQDSIRGCRRGFVALYPALTWECGFPLDAKTQVPPLSRFPRSQNRDLGHPFIDLNGTIRGGSLWLPE